MTARLLLRKANDTLMAEILSVCGEAFIGQVDAVNALNAANKAIKNRSSSPTATLSGVWPVPWKASMTRR